MSRREVPAGPRPARARWRRANDDLLGLVALFLAAFTLRPHVIGIGPVLPEIRSEFAVSFGLTGALVTIPLVCMGLFAVAAVPVSRMLGTRRAIATSLFVIFLFGYARTLTDQVWVLLLLTVPVGIGVGLSGPLLPMTVKERHAAHAGIATGVYATGMQVGSTLSIAAAVPLAAALGGWRWPLAVYSLAGVVSFVTWLVATGSVAPAITAQQQALPRPAWRRVDAWLLAWLFFLISLPFFGLMAWLTAAYHELGWPMQQAGLLTGAMGFAGIAGTIAPSAIARTPAHRRDYLLGAAGLLLLSTLGFVLAPRGAWIWAGLAGLCLGGLFTVVLTLPVDVAEVPREVGGVASVMLTVGYLLSAMSPTMLGAVRDGFGSFRASLWVLSAFGAVLVVTAAVVRTELGRG